MTNTTPESAYSVVLLQEHEVQRAIDIRIGAPVLVSLPLLALSLIPPYRRGLCQGARLLTGRRAGRVGSPPPPQSPLTASAPPTSKDPASDHFILLSPTGADAGTIRYHPPTGKLGRVAVLQQHRGTGAGKVLVEALEEHVRKGKGKGGEWARERGVSSVLVEAMAQWQTETFYKKVG